MPVADHQREIHHVGAGQHLRHGPVLDELLARHPALFFDQLALHHGQHAAKALQRQPGEGPEQIGARARRVQGGGIEGGRRRGHAPLSTSLASGAELKKYENDSCSGFVDAGQRRF